MNPLRWDVPALRAGAGVALVFAIPFSVAARWAADSRDDPTLATFLTLGAVLGFVLGAGCAAWVQRVGFPLTHGIVTAGGTYVVAQALFITIRLLRGDDVNWFAALFNLSVAVGAGLVGGCSANGFDRVACCHAGRERHDPGHRRRHHRSADRAGRR